MADALFLLPEYVKGINDPIARGLMSEFSDTSDILQVCPFMTVVQGRDVFRRVTANAQAGFRLLNQDYEIRHGETEEVQNIVAPMGGLLEADVLSIKRYGEQQRIDDQLGFMRSSAELWTSTFFTGNNTSDDALFNGLQTRLDDAGTGSVDGTNKNSRLMANSIASGGGALSLANLDLAIKRVNRPTHLIMNPMMQVKFTQAMRDTSVSGHVIHYEQDGGNRVLMYGKLPILTGYDTSLTDDILQFNEVGQGGGAAQCSSIYVVSFRSDGLYGIQTEPPQIQDIGHTDKGTFKRARFEWDSGIALKDRFAALRLSSITNAAIVA